MTTQTASAALSRRIGKGPMLVAAGVFDGLSALLAREQGFEAAYLSGYGLSVSTLGEPDVGLISYGEAAARVGAIAPVIGMPLICDAETGFGGPANIRRTVQGFERAGAAAIQIEDQDSPRRCGHTPGKLVVERGEMALRIRIAAEARARPETLLIARTDAIATHGLDEALARLDLCLEAGADIVFAEAMESEAEMARVAREFPGRAMVNIVPGGRTPALARSVLEEMGFVLAIYPSIALVAAAGAIERAYAVLAREGRAEDALAAGMSVERLHGIVGFDAFREFEARLARLAQ